MKRTFLFFLSLYTFTFLTSCGGEEEGKKITCVQVTTPGEFHKITWDKIGDLEALYDQRFEKEIMGKQFGEQHFYTLAVRIKNTSCWKANFTVQYELVTFSNGTQHNTKSKALEPGEEAEFKSPPFNVKGMDDVSDKDFSVQTDPIAKKTKVTYEKKFQENEKTCHCEPTDTPLNSPIMKVIKEEPIACQSDLEAIKEGQVGGVSGGKTSDTKANNSKGDCETSLDKPKQATVATESDNLLVRKRPSLNADIVVKVTKGASLSVSCYSKATEANGKKGRWAFVKYDGKEGWAWDAFLAY